MILFGLDNKDEHALWKMTNGQLMARALSELIYEQELQACAVEEGSYRATLGDIVYDFQAKLTVWDSLVIDYQSITRNGVYTFDALQLCLDLKHALQVDDIVAANWLEDVQNTLSNEYERLIKLQNYSAKELLQLDEIKLQGLLDAHPKIIANRGRLGWGIDDNRQYAPESLQSFQLEYLAVHSSVLVTGYGNGINHRELLLSMMSEQDYQTLLEHLKIKLGTDQKSDDYQLVPCHPWQYHHKIQPQFQWAIQQKLLVNLGPVGDHFQPQQSIRTLSNISRPQMFDVKLAITILNTSCYRGVPERFIAAGHHISQWLTDITASDPLFSDRRFRIQQESAGCFVRHHYQQQIEQAPYRYHEMLGCIWRESSVSKKESSTEQHFLLSALLQKDCEGNSLIREMIQASGLSTAEWLQRLFEVMSVPLYHLMVKYGVGVIAHGQNVVVYLKNWIPQAIAIKDFHGDLRLLEQNIPEQSALAEDVKSLLTHLPKEHLVHDLLTGHFISVYRFLSPIVEQQLDFSEQDFYRLLAQVIADYQALYPQYAERFEWFNLLRPTIERICLNSVRFKIGYQDNAERPLPALAKDLNNPLHEALLKSAAQNFQPLQPTASANTHTNHSAQHQQ
ncbi:IucA/IucC family protein [Kangiella koreensis]|uniref:IucA/IucC family protein n=1 Tax=Kangiella koreensis (strain DSM 16069 / JCM 12317 / KCTC 12182 / SW-125) TaxID=523791 RepID=C7R6Z5_KANKD|nr:IucA/IucC family protein [Kangiella koreensis]ACV27451.1 IucA/IucC family protein [Kangiella koreensis DSM 16069]